jgi:hypothetical protein
MAANQYGIDLGEVYTNAANLKSAKIQNQLGEMKVAAAKDAAKNNAMLTGLRGKAVEGDQAAQRQLLAFSPEEGARVIDALGKMNAAQRDAVSASNVERAQMSSWVYDSQDDATATKRLDYVISKLPEDQKQEALEEYQNSGLSAKDYALFNIKKTADVKHLLENPKASNPSVVKFGGEDIMYQGGKEVGRTASKASSPLVSVNTGGDKKESEKLAELRVKRLDEVQQQAISAESEIESINQIRAIDLSTGLGVETRGQIAKVWNAIGGDGEALTGVNPADVEKFKAVATKQVLDIMATQKGPQTDQDALRIEKAVAGIGNTKEANNFVMDAATSIANRKIEQAAFMEQYLEANQTMKGADSAWRDFKVRTPMVSDVIKDPNTGSPVFFYQFKEKMKARNYSDQDIVEAWRRMNAGGK